MSMSVLNPGQPLATTPGLFPIPVGKARDKLRHKYRALSDAVVRVWDATVNTDTDLYAEGFAVDCEQVMIDASAALVVVRTVDTLFSEVLGEPDGAHYRETLKTEPDGRVVRGLVLPRNGDVHAHSLIEMGSPRLVSGLGRNGFRVFPRWPEYTSLPADVLQTRTAGAVHEFYRDAVGGRLVIETLLDVVRFFDRCDPSLARRTDIGDLEGFPLMPFIEHDYERRHPYWPSWSEMDRGRLARLTSSPPNGVRRHIRRLVPLDNTNLLVGLTGLNSIGSMSFIESTEQVIRDVAGGFPYLAVARSQPVAPVEVHDGVLMVDGAPLETIDMVDSPGDSGDSDAFCERSDEWLAGYWRVIAKDGNRYRQQRRPAQ